MIHIDLKEKEGNILFVEGKIEGSIEKVIAELYIAINDIYNGTSDKIKSQLDTLFKNEFYKMNEEEVSNLLKKLAEEEKAKEKEETEEEFIERFRKAKAEELEKADFAKAMSIINEKLMKMLREE